MSITPRKVDREKDSHVKIHMHVDNHSSVPINGLIYIDVYAPNILGIIKKTRSGVVVPANGCINKYFKLATKKIGKGHYEVDARFIAKGHEVLSETAPNDFFDVVK